MLRGRDGRFTVMRSDGSTATLVEIPGAPSDAINVTFGPWTAPMRSALRPTCELRRMSTFAIGAILNQAVRDMRSDAAFVNVGTWHGFSLLAGMAQNKDRRCIGVDNFSRFGGPREEFMERFEQHRARAHRFFDMDYEDYFASRHEDPIGLYLYDGDHAYDHQVRGLEIAERFFTDDCIVLVDDTNWAEPRAATLDFIARSARGYELLLDVHTAERRHPTFWNGLMVFRATGKNRPGVAEVPSDGGSVAPLEPPEPSPVDFQSRETLVSIVVCNYEADLPALRAAIEAALAQTWPSVEVLVADSSGDDSVGAVIREFGDRVVQLEDSGVREAIDATRGSLAALADTETLLDPLSVEAGLELPSLSRFYAGSARERVQRIRRTLAAGDDLKATIPPNASFVLAGDRSELPQSVDPGRARRLERGTSLEALDEASAIARLDELESGGARFAVFPASAFGWLAERPGFEERLGGSDACLIRNERVRVFSLEGNI